jgi:two-component system, chemotaxis family, CheB/CheR fusion protein
LGLAGSVGDPPDVAVVPHPVDQFFRSLADEQRHKAIGVVLSGTATDGTIGLDAIKGEGGITFAQDDTAQHEGMPHSAIASGCVDFVLPPAEIAREIVRIGQHAYAVPEAEARETNDKPNLAQVVQLLKHSTGVDFTGYKFNTLYRRVTRRMVFRKLDGLPEHVQFLRQTPAEVEALYQDILISVTSFFRDKESFEVLKNTVFPRLLKDRSKHDPVRLWTLGCSTRQEAYSLAMVFTEVAEAQGSHVPLQLFASDLNAVGIEKARSGVYPKDIDQDVSPERLRRFFSDVDGQYRITKAIRDACVFSRHNVLADPNRAKARTPNNPPAGSTPSSSTGSTKSARRPSASASSTASASIGSACPGTIPPVWCRRPGRCSAASGSTRR